MTTTAAKTATIVLYADPHVWGLAYSAHYANDESIDSGPAGPCMDHVAHEDRNDSDLAPQANAAVRALRSAGLIADDTDTSMLTPSADNGALRIVTVTDFAAAARVLEAL